MGQAGRGGCGAREFGVRACCCWIRALGNWGMLLGWDAGDQGVLLHWEAGGSGDAAGLGDLGDWEMLWARDTQRSVDAAGLGSWGLPVSGPAVVVGQVCLQRVGRDECLGPGPWPPAPSSRGGVWQLLHPAHRYTCGPHGAHLLPRHLHLLQQEEVATLPAPPGLGWGWIQPSWGWRRVVGRWYHALTPPPHPLSYAHPLQEHRWVPQRDALCLRQP